MVNAARPSRADYYKVLADTLPQHALVVTSLGNASYLWAAMHHRPENFYFEDAMGLALPLALGLAIAQPRRPVFVVEGDGAVMMHMGALVTVGAVAPGQPHGVADPERRPCRFGGTGLDQCEPRPRRARAVGGNPPRPECDDAGRFCRGDGRKRRGRRKVPCALDETRYRGRSSADCARSRAHQTALHVGDRRAALRADHVRRRTTRTRLAFMAGIARNFRSE